ncbi:hypothetical protein ACS0TY_018959 [Phlomoides rotata]
MPPHNPRNQRSAPIDEVLHRDDVAQLRHQVEQLTAQLPALHANPPQAPATDPVGSDEDVNPFADHHHDHPFIAHPSPPRPDNRRWESGMQMEIPEFTGELQPDDFIDWLSTIEDIMDFKGVPPASRVPLITTHLRGRARAWWQQLKGHRLRMGKIKNHYLG